MHRAVRATVRETAATFLYNLSAPPSGLQGREYTQDEVIEAGMTLIEKDERTTNRRGVNAGVDIGAYVRLDSLSGPYRVVSVRCICGQTHAVSLTTHGSNIAL